MEKPKTTAEGGEMLVAVKTRCLTNSAVLMNLKVFGSRETQINCGSLYKAI